MYLYIISIHLYNIAIAFKEKYLPHIEEAIIRAAKFASDNEALITDIGCNIWILIKEMQSFDK